MGKNTRDQKNVHQTRGTNTEKKQRRVTVTNTLIVCENSLDDVEEGKGCICISKDSSGA